jgi:hypothetical protein
VPAASTRMVSPIESAVGLGCRPDGDHGSGVVYRPFYPAPDTVIAACSSASKA